MESRNILPGSGVRHSCEAVERGHQFAVGHAGGVEVVVFLGALAAQLHDLLLEFVLRRRRSSMSSGPPSPDSRHACSPRVSESRSRSWAFSRTSRLMRSYAPARSAINEARLTAGPVVGEAGGSAALAMTRACRSGCR